MQASEWLRADYVKPACWGAVIGAIAMTVVGFWGMGWTTATNAERMAADQANAAVVSALVPYCVANAQHDADSEKLTKFRAEEASYKRSQIVQESGWATMLGSTSTNYALATACSAKLDGMKTG
jgi:hypothetical protein